MKFGKIFSVIMISTLLFGCKKNSEEQIHDCKISVEEKIYNQLKHTPFESLDQETLSTINAAHIERLKAIYEDSVKYNISMKGNKIIVIETNDKKFFTGEGFSVQTKLREIVNKNNQNILVEPGVYVFVQLADGWRAVISYDISNFFADNIDLNSTIKRFIKVDPELTHFISLDEWTEFMK